MKKLNLFIAVTLVAASSIFTSCKKDNKDVNPPVISMSASTTTITGSGTVTLNFQVNKGDNKILNVKIADNGSIITDSRGFKQWNGSSDKTASLGYYNTDNVIKDSAVVSLSTVGTHTFTAIAYDADNNASTTATVTVTVVSSDQPPVVAVTFASQSTELASQTIHCFTDDGSSSSCYSISQKTAYSTTYYNSGNGNGSANQVDFIYFNSKGTSYGLYSPDYFNNNAKTLGAIGTTGTGAGDVAQWSPTRNKTVFKVASLDYDKATLDDVVAAANSATATYFEGLPNIPIGSVVVFKTASTSTTKSKVGIFKLNSVTPSGTGANATAVISIRIQN
jgi:hypothetical protein